MIQKALLTAKHIKLVIKKVFVAIVLYLEHETFIVYITSLFNSISFIGLDVYLFHRF